MSNAVVSILIGALAGALAVWVATFTGLILTGWMASFIVTAFAVVGGVIGTGLPAEHDRVKPGPV